MRCEIQYRSLHTYLYQPGCSTSRGFSLCWDEVFSYSNEEMEEANAAGMAASDAMGIGRVPYEGLAIFWPDHQDGTPMVDHINSGKVRVLGREHPRKERP